MSAEEPVAAQAVIYLASGLAITDRGPVVVIGPNGSGKTRRSRELRSDRNIEVVNALRNTRVNPQLQPMALQQARANFDNQVNQAKSQPYELSSDFDYLLISLLAESSNSSLEYMRGLRANESPEIPPLTTLEKIQRVWSRIFPGRSMKFIDYSPIVVNSVYGGGVPMEYSAWQMSDGEKAALYLAGRTLNTPIGSVMLIDEPETHFHSLLAAQFWDEIEAERPDIRFIYVTHDMHFASSRRSSHVLLASPADGLTPLDLADDVPDDVAALLLGTASLSFFANRIIFCEGDDSSYDVALYAAWFSSNETTVIRPVGSSDMVIRCVTALNNAEMTRGLSVLGILDRDFHSAAHLMSLPVGVVALGVHEVEALFCLPQVVEAVVKRLAVTEFDAASYAAEVQGAFTDAERHKVIVERWKRRTEASLIGVVASVSGKQESIDSLLAAVPEIFRSESWGFSPSDMLAEEKQRVEAAFLDVDSLSDTLRIMPAKKLLAHAAKRAGMTTQTYVGLVLRGLQDASSDNQVFQAELRGALEPYMPRP